MVEVVIGHLGNVLQRCFDPLVPQGTEASSDCLRLQPRDTDPQGVRLEPSVSTVPWVLDVEIVLDDERLVVTLDEALHIRGLSRTVV